MYIPTGNGRGYPPKIFTNPNYIQNSVNLSDSDAEIVASKPASDWDEDRTDLTQVDENNSKQDKNPLPSDWIDEENENTGGIVEAQPQAIPRQPPQGQASWRRKESLPVTEKENTNAQKDREAPVESNKTTSGAQRLTIEDA